MHKLASLCLLYITLAFVFVLILGYTSYREPAIIQYIATGEPALDFMTAREASHVNDVRIIIGNAMIVALLATLFLAIYASWNSINKTLARDSFIMSLVLMALLIPFNYTYTMFHNLLFAPGTWILSQDTWLIQHFPRVFFMTAAIIWFAGTAALLAVFSKILPQNNIK